MIIGGNAQSNSKNQFPSQKISGNSKPSSVSSTVPRRKRKTLVQESRTGRTSMQRMADHVAKYFVPAVIFIAVSAGVGWYFVGVTGVAFSPLSFFSVIILAIVLVLLVLLVLQH